MNAFIIKIVAYLTMFMDHIGFATDISIFTWIGRISFPLFCFFIAEGFTKTKSRTRYAIRITTMAVLSEIPFDLFFYDKLFDFNNQNVMFTLVLGLASIIAIEHFRESTEKGLSKYIFVALPFVFYLSSLIISSNYSSIGVPLIVMFYFCHGNRIYQSLSICVYVFERMLLFGGSGGGASYLFALIAIIFILTYNGKSGIKRFSEKTKKVIQAILYLLYPVHLIIFYFIFRK